MLVFHKGELRESGTHQELMARARDLSQAAALPLELAVTRGRLTKAAAAPRQRPEPLECVSWLTAGLSGLGGIDRPGGNRQARRARLALLEERVERAPGSLFCGFHPRRSTVSSIGRRPKRSASWQLHRYRSTMRPCTAGPVSMMVQMPS